MEELLEEYSELTKKDLENLIRLLDVAYGGLRGGISHGVGLRSSNSVSSADVRE